jgi:hypothetical protein
MKLPNESSSSEVLINFATYTSVRVKVNQDTNMLAVPIDESIEALDAKVIDRKKKSIESSSKLAIRDGKKDNLDGSILNLSLELLSITGNNRDDIRYKSLLSKNPSSISILSIKEKVSDAKIIVQKLKNNTSDQVSAKHLTLIQTGISECEESENNHQTALENEKSSFDSEKLAQMALREVLVKTYGKLIELKGKKEAEKYFKKISNGKKKSNRGNEQPNEPLEKK